MRKLSFIAALILATIVSNAQDFRFDEVTYTPEKTVFKLFAAYDGLAKRPVQLYLYKNATAPKPYKIVKLAYPADANNSVWTATVKGDLKGCFYTFRVNELSKSDAGHLPVYRKNYLEETPGVFAKAVSVNGRRGAIIDMKETNPEGWESDVRPALKSPADLVIYEMHHRDFSIDRSGAEHPGKFLALSEPWAIEHLKSLGVNAIHILPSYDYGSVDEMQCDEDLYYEHAYESLPKGVIPARPNTRQYNWGYDPVNYNVPEGSYSTNPFDPACRIREFKQMVQALHKAGIRVILDVVYNHTYDIEHSNFQRTYPDYYYRKTVDGQYSNGSGCGNETASERPMMRRFMLESVKYWINEYHIDGFRFDLMGVHDIETMNLIRDEVNKIDPTIFIYGEGWSAGQCAYPAEKLAMKANVNQLHGIAAFSDEMRDALRGPFSDDTKGAFLAGLPGEEESLKFGIAGAISHPQVDMAKVNYSKSPWANEPTPMISYVSCHDDMCLVDRLKASVPSLKTSGKLSADQTAELIRLDLLAQTAVFTSQGVPFMLAGEEMMRDKKGVHNSFESPDSINRIDWGNLQRYPQVFEYYKRLIQLRKNHPAFRLGSADLVRQHLTFLPTQPCLVAYRLTAPAASNEPWRNIIVILNANRDPQTVTIPEGSYTVVCCDGQIDERGLGQVSGSEVEVDAQSALILHD